MRNRLKSAWNCLCGRPTMYRMYIQDGTIVMARRTYVSECIVTHDGTSAKTAYQVWLSNREDLDAT